MVRARTPSIETIGVMQALADAPNVANPYLELPGLSPPFVVVPKSFGDDIGRFLLDAVHKAGTGWDLPP